MNLNKKGIVPALVIPITIAIVAVGLLLAFLFSGQLRIIIIGVGLIVGGIYVISSVNDVRLKAIFAIILIGAGAVFIFVPGVVQQVFSPVSISNVDIVGEGQKILVYATTGGGSALRVDLTPSRLNPFIASEGYATTQSSTLTAEYVSSGVRFNFFTTTNNPVYLLRKVGEVSNLFGNAHNRCISSFPNSLIVAAVTTSAFDTRADCWEKYVNGYVNGFAGGSQKAYIVRFNLDGETKDLTENAQSISLAGGRALISFQGSLLDNNEILPPSAQVFHVQSTWKLVDPNAYTTASNAFQTFQHCVGTQGTSETTFNTCKTGYFSTLNSLFLDGINDEYIQSNSNIQSISFSDGTMNVQLRQPSFRPTFTIELDASKVGIIKLRGKPDITQCVQEITFETATSRAVDMKVKNIGSQSGFFDFSVSCNDPDVSGLGTSQEFNVGEEKTVGIQLNGGNTGTIDNDFRCTIMVTDRNGGGSDSCSFNGVVEYDAAIAQCNIEGSTNCNIDGKTLVTCTNGRLVSTICADRCQTAGSSASCSTATGNVVQGINGTNTASECEAKARQNPLAGYTYVQTITEPTVLQRTVTILTFGAVGDLAPKVSASCEARYTPYYIIGSIIAVMAGLIFGVLRFTKKR